MALPRACSQESFGSGVSHTSSLSSGEKHGDAAADTQVQKHQGSSNEAPESQELCFQRKSIEDVRKSAMDTTDMASDLVNQLEAVLANAKKIKDRSLAEATILIKDDEARLAEARESKSTEQDLEAGDDKSRPSWEPPPHMWGLKVADLRDLRDKELENLRSYCTVHGLVIRGKKALHVCHEDECKYVNDHRGVECILKSQLCSDEKWTEFLRPNMHVLVARVVKPQTLSSKTSFALMKHPEGLRITAFATHTWEEDFDDFVSTVDDATEPDDAVFICSFALDQNVDIQEHYLPQSADLEESPFALALKHAKKHVVVMDGDLKLFTRLWVLFEIDLGSRLGLPMLWWPRELDDLKKMQNIAEGLKSADAEAANDIDKERLQEAIGRIGQNRGGFEDMDHRLRVCLTDRYKFYAKSVGGLSQQIAKLNEEIEEANHDRNESRQAALREQKKNMQKQFHEISEFVASIQKQCRLEMAQMKDRLEEEEAKSVRLEDKRFLVDRTLTEKLKQETQHRKDLEEERHLAKVQLRVLTESLSQTTHEHRSLKTKYEDLEIQCSELAERNKQVNHLEEQMEESLKQATHEHRSLKMVYEELEIKCSELAERNKQVNHLEEQMEDGEGGDEGGEVDEGTTAEFNSIEELAQFTGGASIGLHQLKQLTSLELSLERKNIDSQGGSSIGNAIGQLTNLTSLSLVLPDNSMGPEGGILIGNGLRQLSNLTNLELRLHGNDLGPQGGISVGNGLRQLSNLTNLDLRLGVNDLGPQGAASIAASLEQLKQLTSLKMYLGGNRLGSEGGSSIGNAIGRLTNLTSLTLDLRWNSMGPQGGISVCNGLRQLSSLTKLDLALGSNDLGPQAKAALESWKQEATRRGVIIEYWDLS